MEINALFKHARLYAFNELNNLQKQPLGHYTPGCARLSNKKKAHH